MRPLHEPEIVEKAIRMANWSRNVNQTVFLSTPISFEEQPPAEPWERGWFCQALSSLTRDEVTRLYDSLIEGAKYCLLDGGDFTSQIVRDRLPHIYGEQENGSDK
jgi:hypothetical protein